MMNVTLTRGLSGSGKSTWAKAQVDAAQGNTVIVCKDDLRNMLHNSAHSKGRENLIKQARNALILLALSEGKNVIVADTNFDNHEADIRALVKDWCEANNKQVEVKIKDFTDVPLEVCIERDSKRANSLGADVIRSQYNRWVKKDEKPKMIEHDANKITAVIFDIDGTLTTGPKNRSPYEWSKVGQDDVNQAVRDLAHMCSLKYAIIIVSGRDAVCRPETEKWLSDNNISYTHLFMRNENDNRPDDVVKEEIIDKMILPDYNIKMWVDDRLKVCRMIYRKGIPLFRVGNPDADF
jgi:predicted kinase